MLKEFEALSLDEAKLFNLLKNARADHVTRMLDGRQRIPYPY